MTTPTECALEWCDGELHPADGCNEPFGAWHCITCHEPLPNNMSANMHADDYPTHQLGWACPTHLKIERVKPGV